MATERARSLDLALTAPISDRFVLEEEVLCPFCEYDLRGAAAPRCPECGAQFTWPGVPDPATFVHPYLFEHNPERNIESFLRTFFEGHRVTRFWRTLHPAYAVKPIRLMAYWLIVLCTYVGALSSNLLAYGIVAAQKNVGYRTSLTIDFNSRPVNEFVAETVREYGSLEAFLDYHYPRTIPRAMRKGLDEIDFPALYMISLLVAWPWITFLILRIGFWRSASRPVKSDHYLRIAVYCSDSIVWTCVFLIGISATAVVASFLELLGIHLPPPMPDRLFVCMVCVFGISALWWLYRLSMAARWYLCAGRAFILVPVFQVTAAAILGYVVPLLIIIGFE